MISAELIDLKVAKHTSNIHRGIDLLSQNVHAYPGALGNARWTPELILSTYQQAATGKYPSTEFNYRTGASNGGFDLLRFDFPDEFEKNTTKSVDLRLPLNRRSEGRKLDIQLPVYGGGMSLGSVSLNFIMARAIAAKQLGTLTCTGEGGYPEQLMAYKDYVITQIATGMFGITEEIIKITPVVEFKYAQGAKPGLGGHLLADKVSTEIARIRGSSAYTSLYSPFPFHSVYSVEDHKKHLDWIKITNPDALISVKVSTPKDVDMVAIGSYFAGANIFHVDGAYGGTGAAPEIAKKNIAMPIEFAIPKIHDYLVSEGVRDEITLIASGGIRTAWDVAKAIALGADGCVIGSTEAIAMGCTHCGNCESGRGCQIGIATSDVELSEFIKPTWGAQRLVNLYTAWKQQWADILNNLGLKSISELRGRRDLLLYKRGK